MAQIRRVVLAWLSLLNSRRNLTRWKSMYTFEVTRVDESRTGSNAGGRDLGCFHQMEDRRVERDGDRDR